MTATPKFGDFRFISDKLYYESMNTIFTKLKLTKGKKYDERLIKKFITTNLCVDNITETILINTVRNIYQTGWKQFIKQYQNNENVKHKLNIENTYMSTLYLNALAVIQGSYMYSIDITGYCKYGYNDITQEITAYYINGKTKEFNRYCLTPDDVIELKDIVIYATTYY